MGVVAFAATGFTNPLVGFQVYSFVSGAINSAISGDFGAFAITVAASIATAGFAEGVGLSVANAVQGIGNEFIQGAIQGAAEFGTAGFISGFVGEYARTGSGSSALRGGAWGAAIGGSIGAAIQGSYMAGWQNVAHGATRAETYAARGYELQSITVKSMPTGKTRMFRRALPSVKNKIGSTAAALLRGAKVSPFHFNELTVAFTVEEEWAAHIVETYINPSNMTRIVDKTKIHGTEFWMIRKEYVERRYDLLMDDKLYNMLQDNK